jgi:transposase-like protein
MDEMVLTSGGKKHSLWRAVDQDGNVLDILVQSRRNKHAAKRFFRKLLKGLTSVPRVMITDKLKSYGAAKRELLPGVEHRHHTELNNRAEKSHQPTTTREANATFSISKTCATLSFCIWSYLPPCSTAKASFECSGLPCHFAEPIPAME